MSIKANQQKLTKDVLYNSSNNLKQAETKAVEKAKTLTDSEKVAKLTELKNNLSRGSVTLDDTLEVLKELEITPKTTVVNNKTNLSFEFKSVSYNLNFTSKADKTANTAEAHTPSKAAKKTASQTINTPNTNNTQLNQALDNSSLLIKEITEYQVLPEIPKNIFNPMSPTGPFSPGGTMSTVKNYTYYKDKNFGYQFKLEPSFASEKADEKNSDEYFYTLNLYMGYQLKSFIFSVFSQYHIPYSDADAEAFVQKIMSDLKLDNGEVVYNNFAIVSGNRSQNSSYQMQELTYEQLFKKLIDQVSDALKKVVNSDNKEGYGNIIDNLPDINDYFVRTDNAKELKTTMTNLKNGVYNKTVSGDEALEAVNSFAQQLKEYIKSTYRYADEYANMVVNFAKQDLGGFDSSSEFNLQTLLTKLKENVIKLLGKPEFEYNASIQYNNEWIEVNVFQAKFPITTSSINSIIGRFLSSDNIQERFFAYMVVDKVRKLQLNSSERERFFKILIKELDKAIGADTSWTSNYKLDCSKLSSLNQNKDTSWLDEFYKILDEVCSKVGHVEQSDVDNAKTLSISDLFYGKDKLTSNDILDNLDYYKLSKDPGVRKFVELLEDVFEKFYFWFDIDKKDAIKHLIEFINKKCGTANTNPTTLSQDAINKLNQQEIFAELQNIINSQDFYIVNMVNVDGVIDGFNQGGTGDCWLLAAIKALSSAPAGANLIKNQIHWAEDYSSVTVYFAGVNKYITVTAQDIIEAKQEGRLSSGDDDVLVLELAMKKVYGDINGDWTSTFWNYFVGGGSTESDYGVNGNQDRIQSWLDKLLKLKQQGKHYAASFSLRSGCCGTYNINTSWTDFSWKCTDGSSGFCSLEKDIGHAFAITNITSYTISFVNPWYGSTVYTVAWSEFKNLGPSNFEMVTF